jgi:hypothetical protein
LIRIAYREKAHTPKAPLAARRDSTFTSKRAHALAFHHPEHRNEKPGLWATQGRAASLELHEIFNPIPSKKGLIDDQYPKAKLCASAAA